MRRSIFHILCGGMSGSTLIAAALLGLVFPRSAARTDERGPDDVVRRIPPPLYRDLPQEDLLRFRAIVGGIVVDSGPPPVPAAEHVILGTSVEGRPIDAYLIGTGSNLVVLLGGIHTGPEEETVAVVAALLAHFRDHPEAIPDGLTLAVIPVVNPDGLVHGQRVNVRGVDLNRNWPTDDWATPALHGDEIVSAGTAPLSEPETAALYAFLQARRPALVVTLHGYASLVEGNDLPAAEAFAEAYAHATGYTYINRWSFYPITGELLTAMHDLGVPAIDVELALGDVAAVERNRSGLQAVLELASANATTAQSVPRR